MDNTKSLPTLCSIYEHLTNLMVYATILKRLENPKWGKGGAMKAF